MRAPRKTCVEKTTSFRFVLDSDDGKEAIMSGTSEENAANKLPIVFEGTVWARGRASGKVYEF